ncbi:hypothetical protein V1288_002724 [Bradyrhizobium sp. AZCC 2176]
MIHAGSVPPSPLMREGGSIAQSAIETGEGFSPRVPPVETTPHPALRATFSSHKGRRKKGAPRFQPQFVFATLGGIALVTNDVASSIARPSGVGMVMRNGTRTRVPAIGTNAISIRRSVARYLITGRSGI